jgi:hypothetical protein
MQYSDQQPDGNEHARHEAHEQELLQLEPLLPGGGLLQTRDDAVHDQREARGT